ncbi:MAG TPA: CHAP domain-containing protein [Marmoricola sp.]|nr:CHAP domain-containing protein [Marmoricola sp.]
MSNFVGMDVAAVNRLSLELKAAADRLSQITTEVERIVHLTTGQWDGHDTNDFRQWWSGQHRPKMMAAASAIGGLGQSAANNASEQVNASGGGPAAVAGTAVAGVAIASGGRVQAGPPPTPAATTLPQHDRVGAAAGQLSPSSDGPGQTAGYQAANMGYYGPSGDSRYQCTAWANYRWKELGYSGPAITGNGVDMAGVAGHVSRTPTLGAIASYGADRYGHVMIVEGVTTDPAGVTHITVSEGNALGIEGINGTPAEWGTRGEFVLHGDGSWERVMRNGAPSHEPVGAINFAAFRTS